MDKMTWTLLPDIEASHAPRDLEAEQRENLQAAIGLSLWAALEEREGNMFEFHPNTIWLMDWADRMNAKYGPPKDNYDWCRRLAYFCKEEGNDHPSDEAIKVAKEWEFNPRINGDES